jgi:hypothetical protein
VNVQAQTTRIVKAALSAYADQISTVTTRWVGKPTCDQQTIVMLNAAGRDNGGTVHAFAVAVFGECKVTLSPAGFVSIAWPGAAECEAHEMNRADDNAARWYRATPTVHLRRWLANKVRVGNAVDSWTRARRIRQMQIELAGRQAELCRVAEHFDAFGDPPNDNAVAHTAEHLRLLRSE